MEKIVGSFRIISNEIRGKSSWSYAVHYDDYGADLVIRRFRVHSEKERYSALLETVNFAEELSEILKVKLEPRQFGYWHSSVGELRAEKAIRLRTFDMLQDVSLAEIKLTAREHRYFESALKTSREMYLDTIRGSAEKELEIDLLEKLIK